MGIKEGLKKGQIDSGILIALIIVVFVLIAGLILYFFVFNKGEKTTTLPSGVEVGKADPIVEQCKLTCDSGSKIGFCDVERKVTDTLSVSCKELSTNPQYSSYNVQTCPSIDCNPVPTTQQTDTTTCTGLSGTWTTPTSDGKCPVQDGNSTRKRTPSDNPPTSGQICCYYY